MNRLDIDKQAEIVRCLVEGNSIRSTVRITGAAKNTIVKLLVELGEACSKYQSNKIVSLKSKNIQCDEIWSFVGMKEKNVPKDKQGEYGYGDIWTWTAIDSDSKLMICWHVGCRTPEDGTEFMKNLAGRIPKGANLTTDGLKAYRTAVKEAFGQDINFTQLVKTYGNDYSTPERMYSPAVCTGVKKTVVAGKPDLDKASTSFVERQNLTMRMGMRRFTRLTNAFSKKVENHEAAIAIHYMYYNFCRVHQTLKTTPAVKAGLAKKPWTIKEMLEELLP